MKKNIKTVYPLLKFNKQRVEAMKFYKSCFGGELKLQSVGKSPDVPKTIPRLYYMHL